MNETHPFLPHLLHPASSPHSSRRCIVIFVNLHVIDAAAFVEEITITNSDCQHKELASVSESSNKGRRDTSDLLDIEMDIKRFCRKGK